MAESKNIVITKNHNFLSNFKNIDIGLRFFIFKTKLAFTKSKQLFIKVLIFYYFNPKYHIQIETNTFKYAVSKFFRQLTLNNLD